ncbi:MAG: hypothetical protein R2801_08415 [Chitinophagales bacterium]
MEKLAAPKVQANSILHLKIEGEVTSTELMRIRLIIMLWAYFLYKLNTTGLFDILKALETAKADKNIKAILLEVDVMSRVLVA